MEFQVTEVKLLRAYLPTGRDALSLRLQALSSGSMYTIHAVVPYDVAGFKPPRVGDEFSFEKISVGN